MKMKRIAATFRLSETALKLLVRLAADQGVSRTAVLEALIRREARRQGLKRGKISDDGERTEEH